MKLTNYQKGILSAAVDHDGAVRGVPDYSPREIGPLIFGGLIHLNHDKTRWLATPEGEAAFARDGT